MTGVQTCALPIWRITWSAFVDHLEDVEVISDKLAASTEFMDMVEKSDSLFVGPYDDTLMQVLHGQPNEQRPEYVQAVRAECAPNKLSAGIELGIETATTFEKITGLSTVFARDVTGLYGGVSWFTGVADLRAAEAAEAAIMNDKKWTSLIERAGTVYQSGAITRMFRRLS